MTSPSDTRIWLIIFVDSVADDDIRDQDREAATEIVRESVPVECYSALSPFEEHDKLRNAVAETKFEPSLPSPHEYTPVQV